jgi:hypothetical protein
MSIDLLELAADALGPLLDRSSSRSRHSALSTTAKRGYFGAQRATLRVAARR